MFGVAIDLWWLCEWGWVGECVCDQSMHLVGSSCDEPEAVIEGMIGRSGLRFVLHGCDIMGANDRC